MVQVLPAHRCQRHHRRTPLPLNRSDTVAFMNHVEQAIKEKAAASRKKYLHTHPWAKHRSWAQSRAKKRGWKFNLSTKEAHMLWYRDKASKLVRPSLDRKNPRFGYSFSNCRFIEESLNKSLGVRSQVKTEKQRAASSKNLGEWRRAHPTPWNKKIV